MKTTILLCLLAAGLFGCGDKNGSDPTPLAADPFLGHWQSDSNRSVWYFKDGSVNHDNTYTSVNTLDITSATMTFSYTDSKGKQYVDSYAYSRNGEVLTIPTWGEPGATLTAKSLSTAGFIFQEYVPHPNTGGWAIGTYPFHR